MQEIKQQINQTISLTSANMKARYRKTIAGFLWVVLSPILMYSVQAFVFKKFLNLSIPNYSLFLLGGLLPWIMIVSSWEMSTTSIVTSGSILRSFPISPFVIVSSQILDNFINFLFAFFIVLIPMVMFTGEINIAYLFLPVALFLLLGFVWVSTSFLAICNVFYRDVKYLVSFSVSIVFFLTPIFYPESFVPAKYRWLVDINPIYAVVEPFRLILYEGNWQDLWLPFCKSIVIIITLIIGLKTFWKMKKNELYISI